MHSKNDNIKIVIIDISDEVIEEPFEPHLYQIGLKTSMKGTELAFHCIQLLYYKCHNINLNHGGSHIESGLLACTESFVFTSRSS